MNGFPALETAALPPAEMPTGTITFLFTDIEGSTKLWENHPEFMQAALARHDALLHDAIRTSGGVVFKTVGDAFCAAFSNAFDALAAATNAQTALHHEPWPDGSLSLRVRMALHTGIAEARDKDYFGPVLNRIARLLSAGHGGQTLLSAAAYELISDRVPTAVVLRDLGRHRLKDLDRPEHVFQASVTELPNSFAPLKSLDTTPNNLPHQITSFVGREAAIAQVTALLVQTRLLTLTGAGGSGKTRLSLHIAADKMEAYPDGVWLVELAPLAEPDLVAQTVAGVLSVKETPGQSLTQTLTSDLKNKAMLLVLDNCEHLVSACAALAAALLRACPNIKILTTSREPLGIAGEQSYRVPPLSLPTKKQAKMATVESVGHFEAARLFVERAQAVKNDFCVTNQNAPALAQLCYRLDGIPLAIELAAARARSLAIDQINDRLDARFRILTGGDKSALPRQQTLRALVDWSYDLLTDTEKVFFARLSVFSGGWTLEVAESVCGYEPVEDWEVLDVLTSLVDKSLVVVEATRDGDETRYRLLETLRQYAQEKQGESDDAPTAQARHRDYFVALAEEAETHQWSADQLLWMNRLETEHDNLRAALDTSLGTPSASDAASIESGLRLGGALWNFWLVRGYPTQGRDYLTRAIEKARTNAADSADPSLLAKALYGAGILAREHGDYAEAQKLQEENLALCRAQNDTTGIGNALNNLGLNALGQSDFPAAQVLFEEALHFRREVGNQNGIATSLSNLGIVAHQMGDLPLARARYEESLMLRRAAGNKQGIAAVLTNLGHVARSLKEYETARALVEESLALCTELGNRQGIADALSCLAAVYSAQKDTTKVKTAHEEELTIRRELGDKPGIGIALTNLGNVFRESGEKDRAVQHYIEALALFQEIGNRYGAVYVFEGLATVLGQSKEQASVQKAVGLWAASTALRERLNVPPQDTEYALWLEDARAVLGASTYTTAWETGLGLSWEQAIASARWDESSRVSFPAS